MNFPRIMRYLCLAVAFALCLPAAFAKPENDNPKVPAAEQGTIRTLLGKIYTGKIEFKDDYMLRISNDSGIANIAIVELDEPGFKKYGFRIDRSHDGKFWAERKAALGIAMLAINHSPGKSDTGGGGGGSVQGLSSGMSDLGPFQPLIDAYEKSSKQQNSGTNPATPNGSPNGDTANNNTSDSSFHLFSQPTKGGTSGNAPLDVIKPIITAAESALGIGSSIPSSPSVPSTSTP